MGDELTVAEDLTLTVPRGVRPRWVREELDAVVAGGKIQCHVECQCPTGGACLGQLGEVQQIVGPAVGVE